MAKPSITTRTGKGSPLNYSELDTNFTNLRDATITVTDGTNSTAIDLNGTIEFAAGSNMTVTESGGVITLASTSATQAFKNIAVSGQSTVVADSTADTLTIVAGTGITIATDAGTDTITFTAAGGDARQTINPTTTVELTIDGSTQSPYTYYPTDSDASYFISVDNSGAAIDLRIDLRSLDPDKEYHFVIERQNGTHAVYPQFYYNGLQCFNLKDTVISNVYVCRVVMQDTTEPGGAQKYYVTGTITRDWDRFTPYTP